jgi:hypothetical protein
MRRTNISRLVCAGIAIVCLQGCMSVQPGSMPADKALALSASALSGSEKYGVSGEVSVVDAIGIVANRVSYEGQVTGHGNIKVQWKNASSTSAAASPADSNGYEPLDLLKSIQGKTSTIAYTPSVSSPDQVEFTIKLDDAVAKRRIADHLRKDLTAIGQDKILLQRNPEQAAKVLSKANATLESAIASLKVTTNCLWTANKRTWFPTRLQEETLLQYEWKGKAYQEKRVSVTNFLAAS